MASRTTTVVVHFFDAFLLPGFDKLQPPGDYRVDYDEETIEGVSWLVWRRMGAFIHLPGIGVQSPTHQMVPVNSVDFDVSLKKDNENHELSESAATPPSHPT